MDDWMDEDWDEEEYEEESNGKYPGWWMDYEYNFSEEEKPRGEIINKPGGIEIKGSVMDLIDLKKWFERHGYLETILLDSKKNEYVKIEIRTLWPEIFIEIETFKIEMKEQDFSRVLEEIDKEVIKQKKNPWNMEYIAFIGENTINLSIPELFYYEQIPITLRNKKVR